MRLARKAEKQLLKLSDDGYQKVTRAIDALVEDPYAGAKKMQGEFTGWFRKQISGEYRIAYTIEEEEVKVVEVVWVGGLERRLYGAQPGCSPRPRCSLKRSPQDRWEAAALRLAGSRGPDGDEQAV